VALASISLRGFRNLEPTVVGFAEGSNYLFGPNGAGKTNLLEAIHYLATGRSFRRCPDADLLGFGRDVLIVSGTDESGDTAEIRFDGREKRILRNDIPVEKLSEYFGWLPVVVLLLEDIELVRGAPGIRRNFLDMALAKADRRTSTDYTDGRRAEQQAKSEARSQKLEVRGDGPEQQGKSEGERRRAKGEGRGEEQSYITLVGEYRRTVSQYNRLLERSAASGGRSAEELIAWEEELVRTGVPVYEARLAKMGTLLENAAKHYQRLAGHGAVFSYRSSVVPGGTRSESAGRDSVMSPLDLADAFRQRLATTRERARALRHALVGPHRDDLRITRGERELRKFGSVGEQRLAGIALRLAEADMILSAGRQRPVFLLDEVASELDEERSRMVLEMVAERGQMVYAAARRMPRQGSRDQGIEGSSGGSPNAVHDASALDHLTTGPLDHFSGKEFHVEAGKVSEVS
jgi:DNA replication and repair protein RecF